MLSCGAAPRCGSWTSRERLWSWGPGGGGVGSAGGRPPGGPPLPAPAAEQPPGGESRPPLGGVRFFTARALRADPPFPVPRRNAPAVAQLCYRLDGIPLAIEL